MNLRWTLISAALVATIGGVVSAQDVDLKKTFEEILPGMGAEKNFEQTQMKWMEICTQAGSPGHEADRAAACKVMAEKVGAETPKNARIWLLKNLERIGKGECVDAIAPVVADADPLVRDAAIRALANNPDPAAGNKLRDTLKATADGKLQVALINALGFRAEPASVDALAHAVHGNNPAVAMAAARALGKIGSMTATVTLKSALAATEGEVRLQVGDALAKCGEKFAKGDDQAKALANSIGLILYRSDEPARLAGLELVLKTAGAKAPATILDVLAKGDKLESSVAAGFVAGLDTPAIKALADGLAKLPPAGQVTLLRALGPKRDRAALPAVVSAAASEGPNVKMAALAALGGVGDASTVPLLVKAIQDGGDAANVARHSLETVFADGIDQALVASMKASEDMGRRAQFIELLEHRRATSAVPALLEELASKDGNVRRRAMAALGNVAGPDAVNGMVRALLKITDGGERDEAERAIAAICSRIAGDDERAVPVLAVFETVGPTDQIVLLPVVGRIGGAKALEVVRAAVVNNDPDRRNAGERALCNWPDAAPAEDLAKLVERTTDKDAKVRAIQGLVRVVTMQQNKIWDADKLGFLVRAMKCADRDDERRMIIDRARDAHTFEAVRFVADYLDNPAFTGNACSTIVDLLGRGEVRDNHRPDADKVLDKIIEVCKDKSLVERAKSFKSK